MGFTDLMADMQFLSTPSARRATYWSAATKEVLVQFLSTPSARRATVEGDTDEDALIHFYPRPPRGGRQRRAHRPKQRYVISIHALREEGDHRIFHF